MDNKFTQLCVWEGTMLGDKTPQEFEEWLSKQFNGVRFKFAEEVVTLGSAERKEEGGRHDLLFYVHTDDIGRFAIPRFTLGIRWWEDVVSYNNRAYLYEPEVLARYPVTW